MYVLQVAFVAIGATMVGSISFTKKAGDVVKKGDEVKFDCGQFSLRARPEPKGSYVGSSVLSQCNLYVQSEYYNIMHTGSCLTLHLLKCAVWVFLIWWQHVHLYLSTGLHLITEFFFHHLS
jgi:hypothetical protein